MKNAIMYYYNLIPENIRQTSKYVKFTFENNFFVLELLERNIDEIKEIHEMSLYLLHLNILCHQILPNINNQLVTIINNQPYVLMRVFVDSDQIVTEKELLEFINVFIDNNKYNKINRSNWLELWSSKIDYLEYQVSQFGRKQNIIKDSFCYYIGLAENAIQFLKTIVRKVPLCVSHKRIKKDCTMYDLYNPLELIIDTRVRDYSEYYKQRFFYSDINFNDFEKFIYDNQFSEDELKLLFCRMLFPTLYFDVYEGVIIDNIDERELIPIITKATEYEYLLKKIYLLIFRYYHIDILEWLNVDS